MDMRLIQGDDTAGTKKGAEDIIKQRIITFNERLQQKEQALQDHINALEELRAKQHEEAELQRLAELEQARLEAQEAEERAEVDAEVQRQLTMYMVGEGEKKQAVPSELSIPAMPATTRDPDISDIPRTHPMAEQISQQQSLPWDPLLEHSSTITTDIGPPQSPASQVVHPVSPEKNPKTDEVPDIQHITVHELERIVAILHRDINSLTSSVKFMEEMWMRGTNQLKRRTGVDRGNIHAVTTQYIQDMRRKHTFGSSLEKAIMVDMGINLREYTLLDEEFSAEAYANRLRNAGDFDIGGTSTDLNEGELPIFFDPNREHYDAIFVQDSVCMAHDNVS